jgi:hypothetical protein
MAISEAELAEFMESLESESEASEAAEAASRFRKPSTRPSFRPRPAPSTTPNYVTQVQLQASLARVDGKIGDLSKGVSAINSRVTALSASFKKETEDRKKQVDNQAKDLNQKLQMLALLPVLVTQPSVKLPAGNHLLGPTQDLSAVSVPDTNNLDVLLPVLLVSGLGGAGGGFGLGGDSSSGADNSLLLLALVLAFANKSSS